MTEYDHQGVVAILAGKEKMVALAHIDGVTFGERGHCVCREFGHRAVHLHIILGFMFKRQELINTLNVLAIASLVLFYFFEREWILLITFAFLFGNLVLTPVHEWVAIGWLKFAHLLGMVNSKLLLSGIFFMVVTPLACLRRMLTNDLQASFFFKKEESYFTTVNRVYKHEDFEKTW